MSADILYNAVLVAIALAILYFLVDAQLIDEELRRHDEHNQRAYNGRANRSHR